jgi:hypothetical protein
MNSLVRCHRNFPIQRLPRLSLTVPCGQSGFLWFNALNLSFFGKPSGLHRRESC